MGNPLLKIHESDIFEGAESYSCMYLSRDHSEDLDCDRMMQASNNPDLIRIREHTLNQFAKKMNLTEKLIIQEITQNIINRLSESARPATDNNCMKYPIENLEKVLVNLFTKK